MGKRILCVLLCALMVTATFALLAGRARTALPDQGGMNANGPSEPGVGDGPGTDAPGSGPVYDYVIVTTNKILANSERLHNFVHLKELEGHSVKVITETDFQGLTGQPPNERPEKIRQWLIDNYVTMGIKYVLLIGDPDPKNQFDSGDPVGDIPMKMFWPFYQEWGGRDYPADYFYADLTGNWDLDGDSVYGESLAYDRLKSPDPSMGEDTFSVEWKGKVKADYNEKYVFHAFNDDGVRVYLDGTKIIDNWASHTPANDESAPQLLTVGLHDIEVRFWENTGDAIIRLAWYTKDSDHVPDQIIPAANLYDTSDVVGGLDGKYYDNADFTGSTISRKDPTVDFVWATGDVGPGGIDRVADVTVGRIPVYDDNFTSLDKILGKLIAYETAPGDISWRKSALLAMQPLWSDTPTFSLGEAIKKNITDPAGFKSYRIYDEDYGVSPDKTPTNPANVVGEWKKGYGVVVYDTHGSSTGAMDIIDTGMVPQLDDSKPGVVYGVACSNGYPEAHGNLGFVLLHHGAISTITATRSSFGAHGYWWSFDPASDVNHDLVYYFTKRFITDGKSIGEALWETKNDVPYLGANMLNYNIYGDPDLHLLVTKPNHPPVASAGGPYSAPEGSTVLFDASGSSDPEGDALEYRWDLDNDGTWDTDWSSSPSASFTWGDDYTGKARIQVRDLLGLTGEALADVNVMNVDPTISDLEAYIVVDIALRVAGEKWHDVQMHIYEGGIEIGYAKVIRVPGSPDDQIVKVADVKCDLTKVIEVALVYTPDDDPINGQPNGASPIWVNVSFEDGGYNVTHHTFNVKHPETWSWTLGINQFFVNHDITFKASASDPGSDDLRFTWSWDDGTPDHSTDYLNDPATGPDPYPSTGGTFPFGASDTSEHTFGSANTYDVKLTVRDDDGGLSELVILIVLM